MSGVILYLKAQLNSDLSPLQALQLEPENESYRTNLQTVEEQLQSPPSAPGGTGGGAGPGVGGGVGGGAGAANPMGGELILAFRAHFFEVVEVCDYFLLLFFKLSTTWSRIQDLSTWQRP